MDEVAADTVAIIASESPDKRRSEHGDQLEDLGIDSFSAVEMITDLEEKFDVDFHTIQMTTCPTFQTVSKSSRQSEKLIGGRQ